MQTTYDRCTMKTKWLLLLQDPAPDVSIHHANCKLDSFILRAGESRNELLRTCCRHLAALATMAKLVHRLDYHIRLGSATVLHAAKSRS